MAEENVEVKDEKKKFFSENRIELLCAIFLGITALLTAWATWIGSLHGGNQATNYTKSNNLASEGNSEYNSGLQNYLSDLMAYNTMVEYSFEQEIAEQENDTHQIIRKNSGKTSAVIEISAASHGHNTYIQSSFHDIQQWL